MKNLLKLGKALNKAEQKSITGGLVGISDGECTPGGSCDPYGGPGGGCPDLDQYCVGGGEIWIGSPNNVGDERYGSYFYTNGTCACAGF